MSIDLINDGTWMIQMADQDELTLVIDTDEYAGNFERELFSFVTGWNLLREQFDREEFEELLDLRIDDPGDDAITRSFVTILPTPGFFTCHGEHYAASHTEPIPFEADCSWCVQKLEPHPRFPAYQSVGIFLRRELTAVELLHIKTRVAEWVASPTKADWDSRPHILGYRLIRTRTTWSDSPL